MSEIHAALTLRRPGFLLDLAFTVPARGIVGVAGPSGCGKTTLLRCLAGLEPAAEGRVEVAGDAWQDSDAGVWLPPHRRRLGYVFQEASLFPHLSVRGNLEYGWRRVPRHERELEVDRVVELLRLDRLLGRGVAQLSGGERQRVAIARALLTSPRLLLMDEPVASLDPAARDEVLGHLEGLRDHLEVPIVYVSHAVDELARLADQLLLLGDGALLGSGPAPEILTRLDLPLARRPDAEALVAAEVDSHDDDYHLTHLTFPGGRLTVTREELPAGTPVRVRILARDVSLTLARAEETSILNVLPARVAEVEPDGPAQLLVGLDVAGERLLARITRRSGAALGIAPGRRVFAQVKSAALLR